MPSLQTNQQQIEIWHNIWKDYRYLEQQLKAKLQKLLSEKPVSASDIERNFIERNLEALQQCAEDIDKASRSKSYQAYDDAFKSLNNAVITIMKHQPQALREQRGMVLPSQKSGQKPMTATAIFAAGQKAMSAQIADGSPVRNAAYNFNFFLTTLRDNLGKYQQGYEKTKDAKHPKNAKRIENVERLLEMANKWEARHGQIMANIDLSDSASREAGIKNMMDGLLKEVATTLNDERKGLKGHFFSGEFTKILKSADSDLKKLNEILQPTPKAMAKQKR